MVQQDHTADSNTTIKTADEQSYECSAWEYPDEPADTSKQELALQRIQREAKHIDETGNADSDADEVDI